MKRVQFDTNKNLTLKFVLSFIMLAVSFALALDVASKRSSGLAVNTTSQGQY